MRWPRSSTHVNAHPDARRDLLRRGQARPRRARAAIRTSSRTGRPTTSCRACIPVTCMVIRRSVRRRGRRIPDGLRGRAGLRSAPAILIGAATAPTAIHHIPRVLYHWRKLPQSTASAGAGEAVGPRRGPPGARGLRAAQPASTRRSCRAARRDCIASGGRVRGTPLVSIVIPTAGTLRTSTAPGRRARAGHPQRRAARRAYDHYELIVVVGGSGSRPGRCRTSTHARARGHAPPGRHARAARAVQLLGEHQRRRRRGRGRASAALQRRPRGRSPPTG